MLYYDIFKSQGVCSNIEISLPLFISLNTFKLRLLILLVQ